MNRVKTIFLMVVVCVLWVVPMARAEKFDEFLESLSRRLPIDTTFMKLTLKKSNTRLAHPSLLEKWGIVNQEAAASYNGVLDTVVLKEEYTVEEKKENGKNETRLKNYRELKKMDPIAWSIRLATIFHELSHAEYAWLTRSTNPVDKELIQFLKTDFEAYLKAKHPQYSSLERKIARSELFAYYRDEFISRLISVIDEILLENGYFKSSRSCKNSKLFLSQVAKLSNPNLQEFLSFGPDVDFSKQSLPVIFVFGKEAIVNPHDPIYSKIQNVLWKQMLNHYAPAASKFEVVKWMNSKSRLVDLIKPCRQELVGVQITESENQ